MPAMPSKAVRRAVLGVLVVAFVAGAIYLGATGKVTPQSVKEWLDSLGPGAPILFVVTFVAGSFIGLPGIAFVIGGGLAFGPVAGVALGYGGGLMAVTIPFVVARKLRKAEAGWTPKNKRLAKAFGMLESHPFRSVLVLRLILWFNPPLSYALAFTKVPIKTYVGACAIALFPVVVVAVAATNWLV